MNTQEQALEPVKSLAVNLNESSVGELRGQRTQLEQFISGSLKQNVDFGVIPGTPKPSLYKPGAEKLCKLFQLGSRIVKQEKDINLKENFGMFTYTVEIYHLATNIPIAQCEASANSQEKKYLKVRTADVLNTLQKMAQKRAYVGAVIMATGASDFFTHDIEDMDLSTQNKQNNSAPKQEAPDGVVCNLCGTKMLLAKSGKGYYCPKWQDKSKGDHSSVKLEEVDEYLKWLKAIDENEPGSQG